MARDNKKYVYLTIGILRDSDTHRDLLADAEEHNTKQLPTIAGIRLSEYYQLRRRGLLGTGNPSQIGNAPSTTTNPPVVDDGVDDALKAAMSNAADADDAWPD